MSIGLKSLMLTGGESCSKNLLKRLGIFVMGLSALIVGISLGIRFYSAFALSSSQFFFFISNRNNKSKKHLNALELLITCNPKKTSHLLQSIDYPLHTLRALSLRLIRNPLINESLLLIDSK